MAESTELERRVGRVEEKLDALSGSIESRFDTVDERFNASDLAFVEQREYTEFAFDRLRTEMLSGFDRMDARFNRVDRRLDQFIDTQSRTNALVERHLERLESSSAPE